MSRTASWYRPIVLILAAHALVFALLAIDVVWAVWIRRDFFERPGDATILIALESVRALTVLAVVAVGLIVGWRSAAHAAARSLAALLLLGGAWYAKAFAFAAFPGPVQERIAIAVRNAGVPDSLLLLVFGDPRWVLWLTLAALIRFAVTFPTPPAAARVVASGDADRRGLMRAVPGAGVDVGAAFRRIALSAWERGLLAPLPVWVAAAAAALAQIAAGEMLRVPLYALFGLGVGIALTHLRASASHEGRAAHALRWLARSVVAAGVLALIAGALSVGEGESLAAYLLAAVAPPLALAGLSACAPAALGPDVSTGSVRPPALRVP